MGDDTRFEYLYKFISKGKYDKANPAANADLLAEGSLFVAKFSADGKVAWLPLEHGTGPLTEQNNFKSQADVVIEARRAADLLGATPMDRPEDVEVNAKGSVYVMLTNNSKRKPEQVDGVNPRAENNFGQILEIKTGDHKAATADWSLLVQCGDPLVAEHKSQWFPGIEKVKDRDNWFACPDNAAIDPQGRLWIATDQGENWGKTGSADGFWHIETEGALRGKAKMLFRAPVGAEVCGPCFLPDGKGVFLAVQHPATDGTKDYKSFGRLSSFDDPASRWPDFDKAMPPRPSVMLVTRSNGKVI
jgi:secreted PhoX family phosphatase